MPINNAIYGTSEQWFIPPIQANQDESRQIKMVNFADVGEDEHLAQWQKGVLYNKIQVNEMPDKSLAFGLLPADSSYNNVKFYRYYNNEIEVSEDIQSDLIPIYYCYTPADTSISSALNTVNTSPNEVFSPDVTVYENNASYITQPVATVPYQHTIALPQIIAQNATLTGQQIFTIAEYETQKENFPNPHTAVFTLYTYGTYSDRRSENRYSTTGDFRSQGLKVLPLKNFNTNDKQFLTMRFNNSPSNMLLGFGSNAINWTSQSQFLNRVIFGADKFTVTDNPQNTRNKLIAFNGTADEFISETKRQMSMFGIPFALDLTTAQTGTFDSENMCIPITNNGIGTGEYTQGTGNKDNPAYSWNEQREDSGVDPINPDTNNYVDDTPTSNVSLGAWRVFNSAYVLNANELSRFANYLWNGGNSENWLDQWLNGLKLMGENPINAVIGVKYFPFDIAQYLQILSPNLTGIIIGNNLPPVAVVGLNLRDIETQNNNIVLDLGTAKFPKYFDNFLDFEPYTTAELYIPYCKRIKITPAFFVGKTISIKLIVDLITGACVGCVYSDNILYYTVEGVIGVDIPVTGRDNAGYAQQILSSVMGGVSSAMTGNIGGFIESGLSQMTRPQIETTGTTTPANSFILPQNAYLFIHSPIPQIPSTYAHTFGNACSIGGTVGSFSGFTVFSNTDLTGISATDGEKMQIESLLNTGVYL